MWKLVGFGKAWWIIDVTMMAYLVAARRLSLKGHLASQDLASKMILSGYSSAGVPPQRRQLHVFPTDSKSVAQTD